jgi:hypothetical protein
MLTGTIVLHLDQKKGFQQHNRKRKKAKILAKGLNIEVFFPVVGEELLRVADREVGIEADGLVEVHNGLVDAVDQQVHLTPGEKEILKLITAN